MQVNLGGIEPLLSLQGSLYLSKSMTDVQGPGYNAVFEGGSGDSNDSHDRHQRWDGAGFDRISRVALAYRWNCLCFTMEPHFAHAVNGWPFESDHIQVETGSPSRTHSEASIYGSSAHRAPQLCPASSPAQNRNPCTCQTAHDLLNPSAFCPAPALACGTGYGNSSPVWYAVEAEQYDLTLSRSFKLALKTSLDFRVEFFFNAFNTVQYADPAVAYCTAVLAPCPQTHSGAPRIIQLRKIRSA